MSNPILSDPLAPTLPSLQQQQQQPLAQGQPPPSSSSHVVDVNDPYFRNFSFDDTFGQVWHIFRQRYRAFVTITFINYMVGWIVALIAAYLLGADLHIDGFSVSVSATMSSNGVSTYNSFYNASNIYDTDDAANNDYNNYDNNNNNNFEDQWQMNFGNNDYNYDENGMWVQTTQGMEAWQIMFYYIESAIYYCFLCVAHGASVWLAAHLYLEQHPSLEEAYRQAFQKVGSLVTSLILTGLIIVLPVLFYALFMTLAMAYQNETAIMFGILIAMSLIVWITYVQIVLYHVYPVIMVEKLGPTAAMERSYHLTSDQRCYIFGVLTCWGLLRLFIGFVIAAIAMAGYPYSWQWWLAKSLDTICAILFAAMESVFQAVLYLRSRVVHEQLDRITLAGELGSDILSSSLDQHYIVMGNVAHDENNEVVAMPDGGSSKTGGIMA